jgi:hypothetical protein
VRLKIEDERDDIRNKSDLVVFCPFASNENTKKLKLFDLPQSLRSECEE